MIPNPALTTQPLAEQLRDSVRRGKLTLPPLPELALRLLAMLREPDNADLKRVGDMIEKDQALATSVLRMANSALFGGMRAAGDLSEAAARLGLRQIATMVTTVSHRGHFTTEDPERLRVLRALWEHAVASAAAAKRLTVRGGGDRAEAFLAGLLHDVGKLLVLKGVDEIDSRPGVGRVAPAVLDELMFALHCELGHAVLGEWKLPESIAEVALHHHDPRLPADDLLTVRVQAASAIAHKLGASLHPDPDRPLLHEPAIERLGLGDLDLAELMVDVEDELAQVHEML